VESLYLLFCHSQTQSLEAAVNHPPPREESTYIMQQCCDNSGICRPNTQILCVRSSLYMGLDNGHVPSGLVGLRACWARLLFG